MGGMIIIGVIALVIVWSIVIYNRLVHLRNVRENAFANIDVYLRQRYDLVPQLVATVKGYASHEKMTLENVVKARSEGIKARTISEKISADNELCKRLLAVNALVESYPDLKADRNFLQLQETLGEIEQSLANVRSFFNMSTREYNDQVESFPQRLIAAAGGFRREQMFEVTPAERAQVESAPKISFD